MSVSKYSKEYRHMKKKKVAIKVALFFVFLLILIILLIYLFFYSSNFDVRNVQINGVNTIEIATIRFKIDSLLDQTKWGIPIRSNIYFASAQSLEEKIIIDFVNVKSVDVSRAGKHILIFDIEKRISSGIWCITPKEICYFFDSDGIAFEEIAKSSGYIYSYIDDYRDRTVNMGEEVEDKVWIDNVLLAQRTLQFGNISINGFAIASDSFDTFSVKTAQGWDIKLSNQTNIALQLESLFSFLKNKIKPEELENLQYVDLTVKDRIYYK